MRKLYLLAPLVLAVPLLALALVSSMQVRARGNHDPMAARLIVEDVERFWSAYHRAKALPNAAERAAVMARDYLQPGSPGLQDFTRSRITDAKQLQAMIDAHPKYYAQLEARSQNLSRFEPAVRSALQGMAKVLPDAVFPDIYLLIGRMNSGGTVGPSGLLIGLEMYGLYPDTPTEELGDWHRAVLRSMDDLPLIITHELVHFQQRNSAANDDSLLAAAIGEGVADFVTELATGQHINAHVHAYAEPRAAELWEEFEMRMHQAERRGWIYDSAPGQGRPADLGYWMGYRIAKAYYQRATDKSAAVRAMLQIDDFREFLAASGVAEDFKRQTQNRDPLPSS